MMKIVNIKKAAEIIGVGEHRVRAFVREGRLRDLELGGREIYLDRRKVEQFAELERPVGKRKVLKN